MVSLDDFVDGFVHRDLARFDDDDVLLGRRAVERLDLAHDVHPDVTFPKTTWRPSSQDVFTVQMKNCEPFVSGPALAMDSVPGPACLSLKFSSCLLYTSPSPRD